MDDDGLRARLSHAEGPMEPRAAFADALHDDLAGRLGFTAGGPVATGSHPSALARRRTTLRRWGLLAAAVVALLLAAAAVAGAGALIERLMGRPTLLEHVSSTGALRVAVRSDHPQVLPAAGVLDGFDLDVARAVADRLGVDLEPVPVTTGQLPVPGPADTVIAMTSRSVPAADAGSVIATRPYYRWPVYVVASGDGTAPTLAGLAGAAVCAVRGSAGASWLAGDAGVVGLEEVSRPPAGVTIVLADDDAACLDAIGTGRAAAAVTAWLLPGDLVVLGNGRVVGDGPVAREPAAILVLRDGRGAGELRDRLDAVLEELRRDGTLADLSRRWFGGEDLTGP